MGTGLVPETQCFYLLMWANVKVDEVDKSMINHCQNSGVTVYEDMYSMFEQLFLT